MAKEESGDWSELLRTYLATQIEAGQTLNSIAKSSGVPQSSLYDFSIGKTMSSTNLERLAKHWGFRLLPPKPSKASQK